MFVDECGEFVLDAFVGPVASFAFLAVGAWEADFGCPVVDAAVLVDGPAHGGEAVGGGLAAAGEFGLVGEVGGEGGADAVVGPAAAAGGVRVVAQSEALGPEAAAPGGLELAVEAAAAGAVEGVKRWPVGAAAGEGFELLVDPPLAPEFRFGGCRGAGGGFRPRRKRRDRKPRFRFCVSSSRPIDVQHSA